MISHLKGFPCLQGSKATVVTNTSSMMSLAVARPVHGGAHTRPRQTPARNEKKDQSKIYRQEEYDALVVRTPDATGNGTATLLPADAHVDKSYLDETGFRRPILMRSPSQVDLQVPAQNIMGLKELAAAIGSERRVRAIDVASQRELEQDWSLDEWMGYFGEEPAQRGRVLNLISLECTGTKLDRIIRPPKVVREIGWVEKHWAAAHSASTAMGKKERAMAPKVQLYCLMSAGGSYTEFHIDFGGSSVWYHLYKGQKYFFVIPPTERNIVLFTKWENTYRHGQAPFFGDVVDGACAVVEMRAGDTLLLPSGWIHAVYTPEDSISFGGNFLSGYHIGMHLTCHAREKKQDVEGRFYFPEFECVVWYAAVAYAKMLTTCPSMLSTWEWEGLAQLVTALRGWLENDADSEPGVLDRVTTMCKAGTHSTPAATLEKMEASISRKRELDAEEARAQSGVAAAPVVETTSLSAELTATSSSSSSSSESSSASSDSSSVDSSDEDTGKDTDDQASHDDNDDDKDMDTNGSDSDSSSDDSSSSSSSSSSDEEEERERQPQQTEQPQQEPAPEAPVVDEPDHPDESSSSESDNSSDPERAYPQLASTIPVEALISIRKREKIKELQITKTEKSQVIARARENFLDRQKLGKKKKKSAGGAAVPGVWFEDDQWNVECSCGAGGLNYDDGKLMVQCGNCSNWVHGECVPPPIPEIFWCFKCRADEDQWYFSCPCGKKGKNFDDRTPMVQCDTCTIWQHIGCTLNLPPDAPEPESYICTSCIKPLKKQRSASKSSKKRSTSKSRSKKKGVTKASVPPVSVGTVVVTDSVLPPPLPVSPPPPDMAPPPPPPPSAPPSPSSQVNATGGDGPSKRSSLDAPRKRARSSSYRSKPRGKKTKHLSDEDEDPLSPADMLSSPATSDAEPDSPIYVRPPLPQAQKAPPSSTSTKRKTGGSARDRLAKKLKIRKPRG